MIEAKLKELAIEIPQISAPAANYLPFVKSGNQIFISGQLPIKDGKVAFTGKVGKEISTEEAIEAARICAINIIANLKEACQGDLNKVKQCVKLGIFVNSIDDFPDQPKVANGASDLMVNVFKDKGRHSRFAIGVSSLPRNVPVEIDAIFEIE
jgi:enamine deaminase RidA (YjgF/YER057c/UK114 family)